LRWRITRCQRRTIYTKDPGNACSQSGGKDRYANLLLTISRAASLPFKAVPSVALFSDKFVTVAWTPAMPILFMAPMLRLAPQCNTANRLDSQQEQHRPDKLSVHGMKIQLCDLQHALSIEDPVAVKHVHLGGFVVYRCCHDSNRLKTRQSLRRI
jgi:hypothetical protein